MTNELPTRGNWINGQEMPPALGQYFDDLNPIDDSIMGRAALSSNADIDAAVASAAAAQQQIQRLGPSARESLLLETATLLASRENQFLELLIDEIGSPISKARMEIAIASRFLKAAVGACRQLTGKTLPSDIPGRWSLAVRRPLGVIAAITPFNVPLIKNIKSLSMPLATGNAVVLLPSEHAPTLALALAKLFHDAGFPPGAINVVTGNGYEIGDHLTSHPLVQAVSFTGSSVVGRHIQTVCGQHGKRVTLEMGGKNPVVVLRDADLDLAVNGCVTASFLFQGQICMSSSRIYVHQDIFSEFVNRFVAAAQNLSMGDLRNNQTMVGPIISQRQRDRIHRHIDDAIASGANCLTGGQWDGHRCAPTILSNISPNSSIAQEETFGPVTTLHTIQSLQEAIAKSNEGPFGLSASIYTRDIQSAMSYAEELDTGMVHINGSTLQEEPHVPFGGVGQSGFGRESSDTEISEFTQWKWITVQS